MKARVAYRHDAEKTAVDEATASDLLVDEGTSAWDQKNADIVENTLRDHCDFTLILLNRHFLDQRKAQLIQYALEK